MQAQPSEEHYKALFGAFRRKDSDVYHYRARYVEAMIEKLKTTEPMMSPFSGNTVYLDALHDRIEYLLGFPMVPDAEALRDKLREATD